LIQDLSLFTIPKLAAFVQSIDPLRSVRAQHKAIKLRNAAVGDSSAACALSG